MLWAYYEEQVSGYGHSAQKVAGTKEAGGAASSRVSTIKLITFPGRMWVELPCSVGSSSP